MIVYSCQIPLCSLSNVRTTDRKAIFRHYITHLKSEIENAALGLDLPIQFENKYSIINLLIHFSKIGVIQK